MILWGEHMSKAKNENDAQGTLPTLYEEADDTSIEYIKNNKEDIVYDLLGRRITTPTRGIYIVNGKKVIFD